MYVKPSYEPQEKEDQQKVKPEEDTEKQANEAIRKGKKDGHEIVSREIFALMQLT